MDKLIFNIERAFNASEAELSALRAAMKKIHLDKGAFFLKSGEICHSVAFIDKGSMRLFYDSPDKEVCNDFFFENSIIGSFASFLAQAPSIVNIAAIEKCTLFTLHYDDVVALIRSHPSLREMANIIIQEQLIRAERREAVLLRNTPEERFRNLMEEHPKIFKRVPLHYVASYLSITPETLSRYRTKFLA